MQIQHGSPPADSAGSTSWYDAVGLPTLLWYDVPGESVQRRQEVLILLPVVDVEMRRSHSTAGRGRSYGRSRLSSR